jgi:hypothetical protein
MSRQRAASVSRSTLLGASYRKGTTAATQRNLPWELAGAAGSTAAALPRLAGGPAATAADAQSVCSVEDEPPGVLDVPADDAVP